ncbi:helix-turn-helix domain-containing protein [Streptomyces sp. NPDC047985]|uniref:helix-turn-helix domain-containing protein n=1 Tax=unclassified Streptomyces TaxID=2593676 RepID=UPI003449C6E8
MSEDERAQIADLLCAGHSPRSTARRLGGSPSTISRELPPQQQPRHRRLPALPGPASCRGSASQVEGRKAPA